jgi:hypothetical protein
MQDCHANKRISEDFIPLGKSELGGQDDEESFIPAGRQLKKDMGAVAVDRDVADFILDNQSGCQENLIKFSTGVSV